MYVKMDISFVTTKINVFAGSMLFIVRYIRKTITFLSALLLNKKTKNYDHQLKNTA